MTVVDDLLHDATGPYGEPRFWPKGQHPATYRNQQIARRLRQVIDLAGHNLEAHRLADAQAAIAYHDQKVAEFDAGEARAKQQYVRAALR